MEDLFAIGFALIALWLYMMFAAAVAALGAIVGAGDAIANFIARLGGIMAVAIRTRGGDQRVPRAPEPAFEIYVGPPLVRDFKQAFTVSVSEIWLLAARRRQQANARFTGAMRPLAVGVTIGAYTGGVIGVVVGSIVAAVTGLVVVLVAGCVWTLAHVLQGFEKARRKVRGAHFDCPSCHERSPLPVYVCPSCGAKHHQLLPGRWGIRHRRCQCDQVLLPCLESGGRHSLPAECPHCQHVMPGASGIVPEISVPIIGGPKAGKTAMLASALVELDEQTRAGASRLSVVADSRTAFDQLVGDLRAGRVPAKTLDRDVTPALVAEVRSGDARSGLLYAHDVAGERYQVADTVRGMSPMLRARGVVLLVDPFSLYAVGVELAGRPIEESLINPSAEDPQSVAERFIQALRESGRSDFKRLPVAVVVSKTDALAHEIQPGSRGQVVSGWLEGHGGGNLVRLLEAEFETVEFFASSALGRLPDPSNLSAFVPVGTLEPLVWLLEKNRISMSNGSSTAKETVTEKLGGGRGARTVEPIPPTPLFTPKERSKVGYAAGVGVAIAVFGSLVALSVQHAHPSYAQAAYVTASGQGAGNANVSAPSDSGGTDSTGDSGSADDTESSATTGSTGADRPQMSAKLAGEYASRQGASNVEGVGRESCASGITVSGIHTDCSFAGAVQRAYQTAGTVNAKVSVVSPDAPNLGALSMNCVAYSGNVVGCVGGIADHAIVFFDAQ